MRYTPPTVERTQVLATMGSKLSCANILCRPGYICVNGECVPEDK